MGSRENDTIYGQCRCCLAEGYHRDLTTSYIRDNNIRETYLDMFVDCFNVFFCTDLRLSTLICLSCAQLSKDAYLFKMKVLEVEKQLLEKINPYDENETVFVNVTGVSNEVKENENDWLNDDDHNDKKPVYEELDIDEVVSNGVKENEGICKKIQVYSTDDVLPLHESLEIDEVSEFPHKQTLEQKLLSRFPRGSIQKLPTAFTLHSICPGYAKELAKLKGKIITAKMLQCMERKINQPCEKIMKPVPEKYAHITNITTLLRYSNLTAFKTKYKNGFPCFYCLIRFESLETLRKHQFEHINTDIRRLVASKYRVGRPDGLVVYVDVTDLKCTICNQSISNLLDLKSHLVNAHKKTLYFEYTDRVIPFKMINNLYRCQSCNFDFETFGVIERHMNTHYRNFVCEECGAGFIAKHRLKIHRYTLHSRLGRYPCRICGKFYPTHSKMKIHFDTVHSMSRKIKCPKCPAKFLYYVVRQKHLVDVHGEEPILYRCNVCEKAFKRRYYLTNHIKKDHLNERNINCELCSFSCFSNNELQVHLVKEHGEKLFECSVCKKCYSSQKSLSQHYNVHKNDKFCCVVCGESFLQIKTFKRHMQRHVDLE